MADDLHGVRRARVGIALVFAVHGAVTGTFATPRVFFYRRRLDAAALRDSLAATLPHFPLLTGRLVRDPDGGLSVDCGDAGRLVHQRRKTFRR